MKIHEYQAKKLFRKSRIPVPAGNICKDKEKISSLLAGMQMPVAVKAQILAGGRGKGGGVVLARTTAEVQKAAENILGMQLITKQTGDKGTIKYKPFSWNRE